MTTVLLVRHGQTAANAAGLLVGRSPGVELDEVGQQQIAAAGARLATIQLCAVVTSPLRRCRQTAQAIQSANHASPEIAVEQRLVECGYGEWTGRPMRELIKQPLWQSVQQQPSAVRFPGGESMAEMSGRAVSAIRSWDERLAAEHGDDAIWVAVSHGDVIKAVLADALAMHLDSFQRILVDPGALSVVRYAPGRPRVLTMNSTGTDIAGLLAGRGPKQRRGRRRKVPDAPPGGGLGAADVVG
jgi:probable phosphomutase (TIGR03848 family)